MEFLATLLQARRRRLARNALGALSRAQLADIGIEPGQIESVVSEMLEPAPYQPAGRPLRRPVVTSVARRHAQRGAA